MKKQPITRATLESLSAEELLELIEMSNNVSAKDKKEIEYVPNNVQAQVHSSPAFIRALFSGNGVGKTTACIKEAIWTSTGTHPYRETARLPNTVIIVLDDASKADTVYMAELRKRNWYDISKLKLDKKGRAHTVEVTFPNGSNWIFMTHQMDEEKWESIQCACVIFDEPPPRFIFVALMRGMREQDMKPWMMFAGTPRGRNAPWMYKEIYSPWKKGSTNEIECFFGSTHDNLHNLDPDTIKRWEAYYTKEELKTRLYGSFEFLSGRVFDGFNADLHVEEDFPWPKKWPVIVAVDPHLRKNHVGVVMGIDPDGDVWVIKEIETHLAGRRAARYFLTLLTSQGYNVRASVCDNFGSVDMYEDGEEKKSFIKLWNEEALKMNRARLSIRPTTRAEKRDDEWIEDMRDWLRLEESHEGLRPRFHVFKSCVKLIDNFETYVWDEHTGRKADLGEPKETPLGTNQDYLMCVKYGLALKPDKLIDVPIIFNRNRSIRKDVKEYESTGAFYKD